MALVALVALAAPAHADKLVALFPLKPQSVDSETAAELDLLLRSQTGKLPGVILQSRKKLDRALARAAGPGRDCGERLACIVEVGELSGAHVVVFGTAAREADAFLVDLRLIDVDKEKIVNRVPARLTGNAYGLAEGARGLMSRLLLPEQFSGTLEISMLVPGARVLLDGLEVGVTPMEPLTGLKPRLYTVAVLLEGAEPLQKNVQIRQATTTTMRVGLREGKLLADIEHSTALEEVQVPPVAAALAGRLRAAPQRPAERAAPPGASAAGETEEALSAVGERAAAGEVEVQPLPWRTIGISLGAGGALLGVLGGAGVAAWGFNFGRASSSVDPGGIVLDQETYQAAERERPLFDTLGIAGSLALPLGLAAVAGGIGLMLLAGDGETNGDTSSGAWSAGGGRE